MRGKFNVTLKRVSACSG